MWICHLSVNSSPRELAGTLTSHLPYLRSYSQYMSQAELEPRSSTLEGQPIPCLLHLFICYIVNFVRAGNTFHVSLNLPQGWLEYSALYRTCSIKAEFSDLGHDGPHPFDLNHNILFCFCKRARLGRVQGEWFRSHILMFLLSQCLIPLSGECSEIRKP